MKLTKRATGKIGVIWQNSPPAPEFGTSVKGDVWECAFEGCMNFCGYDLSVIEKEEQDRIFVAVLDALPQGKVAAEEAAAQMLKSIAVAGNWEDLLICR